MKTTVTKTEFRDTFHHMGRGDNFSYDGLGALFDWLEQLEEDAGEEMQFDCIALCCDFSEFDSAKECVEEYQTIGSEVMDEGESLEWLRDNTLVIEFEGGIIIQQF